MRARAYVESVRRERAVRAQLPSHTKGSATAVKSDACLCLDRLVVLIGYFVVGHAPNQECLQWSCGAKHDATLLTRLLRLPMQYFGDARGRAVLFPTLIAGCLRNERNCEIAASEVTTASLAEYLREHMQTVRAMDDDTKERPSPSAISAAAALAERIPVAEWESAAAYFDGCG